MKDKAFNIPISWGEKLHYTYITAKPYPNIILDHVFKDVIGKEAIKEFDAYTDWAIDGNNPYMEKDQVNKFFTPWSEKPIESLSRDMPVTYSLLQEMISGDFLTFLRNLTGIYDLIPDKTLLGGGVHKVTNNGKLSLHLDYNVHPYTGHYRALNVLLYMNPRWDDDWGGNLELYDVKNKRVEKSILPLFNRLVIFSLSEQSVHGHPTPLTIPENMSRYALALYYYTENVPELPQERKGVTWYR